MRSEQSSFDTPPKKRNAPWLFALVFAFGLLFTLLTLGHASPPRSRGARPIALGNGYSAVSGDAYTLYYNPAGLYEINQKEVAFDYGRWFSPNEPAGSDFNSLYATPYRFKDRYFPIAIGMYGESPADGAHIFDITVGAGGDAPADRWTKGIIKFPVKAGVAVNIKHQGGEGRSDRVGKSAIGLGLTGGFLFPINKQHQAGLVIRNLTPSGTDPRGPSISAGLLRKHAEFLHMYADLEYASGGVWRFHPGFEWLLARGVMRPRLGWGFRENGGIDMVATGVGFYLSPFQMDIAYLIPTKTLNDDAGQFRASLSYRFGRPQFSEIYYDRALEAASQLDQNVIIMTAREAELKASLAELEQKMRITKEELANAKGRIEALKNQDLLGQRDNTIRELKDRVRALEGALADQRSQTHALRTQKATVRTHTVKAGDTLQSIAREYYGDPNQWKKIYSANPDKIERGLPKTGATLVIP